MSYSNYSTYLKYKNCCRPIGDTGPPGPTGPRGPTITGNKGEILYFSETDNLVSTDNVFIQEGNVTINNNLVVTGTTYLNNTLDVSGSTTIQNGVLKVLNPNDKISSQFQTSQGTIFIGASNSTRFGDVSYNLIFSTGTSNRNGLAIGTFSNTEPLILGVDNREVIRITDNGEQRVGIKTSNPSATLEVSGNVIFNGNLSMNNNFINDVSGIYFTKGNLLFSDFSSVNQSVQLPSSQGQPISLERKTLFYQPSYNLNIPVGNTIIDFTDSTLFNQLKLNVNGNEISSSPDISGQFIEIYANFDVSSNTSPSKTFSLDISSVSGLSFLETIDVRSISKQGRFYLTFGPHIFTPEQWENTTGFNFIINNTSSNSFFINSYKLMFKSYFM